MATFKKRESTKKKPQPALTEWQKRNLEFQQRKKERQAEKERLEAEALQKNESASSSLDGEATETDKTVDSSDSSNALETPVSPDSIVVELPKVKRVRKKGLSQKWPKALPIIFTALIVLLLALFTISPFSKQKIVTVSGLQHAVEQEIIKATGIASDDYITHTFFNLKTYEKALVKKNPWVKKASLSYQFPNKFAIAVEENAIVAYNETADGFRPILENGEQVAPLGDGQLPEGSLPLKFDKQEDTASFIRQFISLDPSIRQSVKQVAFANSASTPDLLLLTMAEGHTVRVPLSEIDVKLPYYKTIKDKLTYPQIIDMEVGIYTTTPELEASAAETKASKEQESRELAALNSASSSSDTKPSTRTETSSTSSTETN